MATNATVSRRDMIERALERAKPNGLAMVGDSFDPDVLGPRRFGIHSVWFNEDGRQPAPVESVPTIHRLPELVPLMLGGPAPKA